MKKSEFTKAQQENLDVAKFRGEMAYYKNITAPGRDESFMIMLPTQPNGVIIENEYCEALFKAWQRGWRMSQRENETGL